MAGNDIARVYATSLVEIGTQKNVLSQLEEELKFVADCVSEEKDLQLFLSSPGFSKEAKSKFVKDVFSGKLSDHMVNFLIVLIQNDRQDLISEIYQAVLEQIDDVNNRQRVTIISRSGLDTKILDSISSVLKNKLKKEIILKEETKESLLGGIIIKIDDVVIDGSLAKDLKKIRTNLLNSKVRSEVAYED